MAATEKYSQIKSEITFDFKQRVLRVIEKHRGKNNRVTKEEIARALFLPYSNNKNDKTDRQIRMAVNELRKDGYLILSDSSGAGYWYAEDYQEVFDAVAELESRSYDLLEQAKILRITATREFSPQLELL